MKKFSSVISLSFLVLFLLVGCGKSSDDWVEYHSTEDMSVNLYNKKTITKSGGKNIVQVSVKWIYSDKDREDRIKDTRNGGLSTEGYSKLSYGIFLEQIDCKNKKTRILSITDYDTDGRVLFREDYDKLIWISLVPNTNGDRLREIVCK